MSLKSAVFSVFLLYILLQSCTSKVTDSPPNILFIMSDDHTSQAWGIYGGILKDYVKNDNIQRLARSGTVMENVFCTNSICVPSRASIMTGSYSHINQVYTLLDSLKKGEPVFTTKLKELGYETAIVGKWHLKDMPQGFDYVEVLPGQGVYNNPVFRTIENWDQKDQWNKYEGFSTDVISNLAMSWLDRRSADQPFFLMTHFKATHEPFDYPERMNVLYSDDTIPEPLNLKKDTLRKFDGQELEILGERFEFYSRDSNLWERYPGLPVDFHNEEGSLERRREIYQKFIKDFMRSGATIDENIGRILDYLDKNGLADNTIVIYTADQGYFLGEHGFFDKRIMYEEALRMPFVIRYPNRIPSGKRNKSIVLNIDFPALILDYAGGDDQFGQGRSFRRIIEKENNHFRDHAYYRYWQHLDIRPAHLGLRNERYKLIYFYGDPLNMEGAMPIKTQPFWEFYDLKEDPYENHNLIDDPSYARRIEEMKRALLEAKIEVGDAETNFE